jgi:RNA polymerase sigma factor (sigma-70 family)
VRTGAVPSEAVELCRSLHPRLVGTLALHCGDVGVAEEIAQDALVRVVERWSAVSRMDSPDAWAFRVAFNLTASRFRRRAAERRANERAAHRDDVVRPPDRAEAMAVREAVSLLPERQRAAVVLRYFADLSVRETASALGCAEGTVKSLTSQAITALRGRLVDVEPEVEHA